jgi:hypothetical protein
MFVPDECPNRLVCGRVLIGILDIETCREKYAYASGGMSMGKPVSYLTPPRKSMQKIDYITIESIKNGTMA